MPADFDKCQNEGGKIRTKTLGNGKYMHICIDKNGKTHAGEVKIKERFSRQTGLKLKVV